MSLSKVKSVQGSGSFENDYGTLQENGKKLLFKFEYEMEDGTIITANHKTNDSPFPVGTEVDYEVKKTHPEYGKSGTVKKPESSNYSGSNASYPKGDDSARQLMIVRQSSLNRAVEILIHNATRSQDGARGIVDELEVIELAERLTKWVMQSEKKEPTPQPEKVQEVVQDSGIGEESNDGLPF